METMEKDSFEVDGIRVDVFDDDLSMEDLIRQSLDELTPEQVEYPTFLIDLGEISASYRQFQEALPNVEVFYAVKCNHHPLILKLLASLGSKFDCASQNEIKAALKAGAAPDDIIYANTNKYESHLKFADKCGVNVLVFDDILELEKIKRSHKNAKLVLRITGESKTVNQAIRFGAKSEECSEIFKKATALGFEVVGVSFHIGSYTFDADMFARSISMMREVVTMGKEHSHNMSMLDLGGGFPSGGVQGKIFMEELTKSRQKSLEKEFPNLHDKYRLIAEPGYAIVKTCGTEIFTVIGKKERRSAVHEGIECALADFTINDSKHCSLNDYKPAHYISHAPRPLSAVGKTRPLRLATIWGYSLNSKDIICDRVMFPDVGYGEQLYMGGRGAYATVLSTTFNGYGDYNVRFHVRRSLESLIKNSLLHS